MSCFIALPIKGEAFLYMRAGRTILVDGGYSGTTLASALKATAPELRRIDIVVCTHADSDHAGGLRDFLDYWKDDAAGWQGDVGQFWLPGRWASAVRTLASNPKAAADRLMQELQNAGADFSYSRTEAPSDDDLVDQIKIFATDEEAQVSSEFISAHRVMKKSSQSITLKRIPDARKPFPNDVEDPKWMKGLRKLYRDHEDDTSRIPSMRRNFRRNLAARVKRHAIRLGLNELAVAFWNEIIDTAESILLIAITAFERDIPIRWFDFDVYENRKVAIGGWEGVFEPVNAVELEPYSEDVGRLFFRLALSRVNIASLVFYGVESCDEPGVLFCADSALHFDDLSGTGNQPFNLPTAPCRPIVITAPHHGSANNDLAYQLLGSWRALENAIWVRSGGKPKHPTSNQFKHQVRTRVCSRCQLRDPAYAPAAVIIPTNGANWTFTGAPRRPCNCR